MAEEKQTQAKRFWAERKERLPISGISIAADWYTLLGVLALLLVVLLTSAWFFFRSVAANTSLDSAAQATTRASVNEEQLNRVVERFTQRATRFGELSGDFVFSKPQQSFDVEE